MAKIGKRIRRLRGYTANARYRARSSEQHIGTVANDFSIPSPYCYTPDRLIYLHADDGPFVMIETKHRQFDVFAVDDFEPEKTVGIVGA